MPLIARDNAVGNLHHELLWSGPPTLFVTSLIAYLLAAAALRPVDRLRRRAATISEHRLSECMPVASANDVLPWLGHTLNDMLARIETTVGNERRFVADASHELRSPLSLLRAEVELALEQPLDVTTLRDAKTPSATARATSRLPPRTPTTTSPSTTRADEARTGTGLGLAVVAEIVASHEGTTSAANLPQGGASVS